MCPSITQDENRKVLEIVCSKEDVLAAHHRVSGMNFIPCGYVVLAGVQDARAEAKSQFIASAPADMDTEPPSSNVNKKKFGEDE